MDSPEPTDGVRGDEVSCGSGVGGGEGGGEGGRGGGGRERRVPRLLFRCFAGILVSLVGSFLLSFLFGLAAIAIGSFSSSSPVSVPAACRIVSSSVDLRSSKVCELGLLNYKAKHVLYPSGKTRFRCRSDYYWASVFEVEYRELFSGQMFRGVAEAPKEALPHDCRPSFSTAWSLKRKFKVNETYSCRYTLGSRRAEIYASDLYNCEAKDPSIAEMIRRFFILFKQSSSRQGSSGRKASYAAVGVASGMLSSICLIIFVKILQISALALARQWHGRKPRVRVFTLRFRRVCLLIAYISAMGWLTLEYGKMIGLKQLMSNSNIRERTVTS